MIVKVRKLQSLPALSSYCNVLHTCNVPSNRVYWLYDIYIHTSRAFAVYVSNTLILCPLPHYDLLILATSALIQPFSQVLQSQTHVLITKSDAARGEQSEHKILGLCSVSMRTYYILFEHVSLLAKKLVSLLAISLERLVKLGKKRNTEEVESAVTSHALYCTTCVFDVIGK